MAKITFRYQPRGKDYRNALRAFYLRQRSWRWILGISLALGLLIVGAAVPLGSYFVIRYAIICLGAPLAGTFLVVFMSPVVMAARINKNEKLREEVVWQLDEGGAVISTPSSKQELDWGSFAKLVDTQDHFLLVRSHNKNMFHIIPKRAFPSQAEQNRFVALVQEGLARRAKGKPHQREIPLPLPGAASEVIPFQGDLTLQDMVRAQYLHNRDVRQKSLVFAGFFACPLAFTFFLLPEIIEYILPFQLVLIVVLLNPWWLPRIQARLGLSRIPLDQRRIEGHASGEGIRLRSGGVDSLLRWDIFDKVKQQEDVILLYRGLGCYDLFSRHCFAGDGDWQRFLALVRARIESRGG